MRFRSKMNMKHLRPAVLACTSFLTIAVLLFSACAGMSDSSAEAISGSVLATIERLASPDFDGRLTGSRGNQAAAEFLATELQKAGFRPMPDADSFLLPYSQRILEQSAVPSLTLKPGDGQVSAVDEFSPQRDFQILIRPGVSISGTISVPVVQLSDVPQSSEDWQNIRGKAVIIGAELFATLMNRSSMAPARLFSPESGPAAILLANPEGMDRMMRGVFLKAGEYGAAGPFLIQLTWNSARTILRAVEDNPELELEISAGYSVKQATVMNVAGVLPGDDRIPPMVLSAHMDGQGRVSPELYLPGAVDNGSGVAAVLEAASMISRERGETGGRSSRSRDGRAPVVVVFFNGEEQGLYGSRAFEKRYARLLEGGLLLNVDMVGHSADNPIWIITGGAEADVQGTLLTYAEKYGGGELKFELHTGGGSDHASFAETMQAFSFIQIQYPSMHGIHDTPENVRPEVVAAVAEILAGVALEYPGLAAEDR